MPDAFVDCFCSAIVVNAMDINAAADKAASRGQIYRGIYLMPPRGWNTVYAIVSCQITRLHLRWPLWPQKWPPVKMAGQEAPLCRLSLRCLAAEQQAWETA